MIYQYLSVEYFLTLNNMKYRMYFILVISGLIGHKMLFIRAL